ncbi:hypothetical protein [Streptomyces sp. NPDC020965]|uniref:hypothetical protein n=1 Tax=Streptomyces sp. NPDC020965 TaxID=3365105 RepID=UPI00379C715E
MQRRAERPSPGAAGRPFGRLRRYGRRAAWRAAGRALWRRAAGLTRAGERRSTAQFLLGRMLLLPAVALTVLALAATAYFTLNDRTEQLRDRYAPALVELTHARVSLTLARFEAERRLGTGDRKPLKQTDLVGLGERYPSLLTEASQSLNNVAQTRALRRAQEQEVRVVSGLVVAYDNWINWANSHHESDGLRRAGLEYAAGLLGDGTGGAGSTAVLDRVEALERELRADVEGLSGWSAPAAGTASAALLVALFFAFTVIGTLDFVRGQLRVRSPLLTVYAVPVLLVLVVLGFGVAGQHRAQRHVGETADRLGVISVVPRGAGTGIGEEIRNEIATDDAIEAEAEALAADLSRAHPRAWTPAAVLALALGTAGALACGLTLFHYDRRHLAIHWRTT